MKYETTWCELESGQTMQKLHYFIGERGWWSAEGLNERVIREENVYVTEIVLRIKLAWAPKQASQEQSSGGERVSMST